MNTIHHSAVPLVFEKKVLLSVLSLGGLCAVVYVYFMGFSILHTVEREEFTREAVHVQEEVAALERTYLTRSAELSPEVARQNGFVAVATPTYIARTSLSYNNSR